MIVNKVPIYHWDAEKKMMDEIKPRLFDIFANYTHERNSES